MDQDLCLASVTYPNDSAFRCVEVTKLRYLAHYHRWFCRIQNKKGKTRKKKGLRRDSTVSKIAFLQITEKGFHFSPAPPSTLHLTHRVNWLRQLSQCPSSASLPVPERWGGEVMVTSKSDQYSSKTIHVCAREKKRRK